MITIAMLARPLAICLAFAQTCAISPEHREARQNLGEQEMIVQGEPGEFQEGATVLFVEEKCKEQLIPDTPRICKDEILGHGKVTKTIDDTHAVVQATEGIDLHRVRRVVRADRFED